MDSNFKTLTQKHGAYSIHYLIHLYSNDESISMYFCDDNRDIQHAGNIYKSATMKYEPSTIENGLSGGGKLDIEVAENLVIDLNEKNIVVNLEAVEVIIEKGTVKPLRTYRHKYGTLSGDKMKASYLFKRDERMEMTFPTLIFSNQNNRGNA